MSACCHGELSEEQIIITNDHSKGESGTGRHAAPPSAQSQTQQLTLDGEADLVGHVSDLTDGVRQVIILLHEVEGTES